MNFSLSAPVKSGFIRSQDNTSIFFHHYPLSDHKAVIFLVHGFGEHSARYAPIMERLVKEGYEVLSIDLRGHGHSLGNRGYVNGFINYEQDVIAGLAFASQLMGAKKKLFMLAHSMGALVSLRVILSNRFHVDGIVMSSPLFHLRLPMPLWKKWGVALASRVMPKLKIKTSIKGNQLSSDNAVANGYDADPLVFKKCAIRTVQEIIKTSESVLSMSGSITTPFLMQVGDADPIVDSQAAVYWFNKVNRERVDATLKIYPNFLHEIYNETKRENPINDAISWFNQRV